MPGSLPLVTSSPEETRAVGEAVAELLGSGDVIALTGDLGAGKTTLVQGAARALGVEQPVLSPTFTLVREYRGSVPIYHLDLYRLDRLQDVIDLGFDEMVDQGAVVFIEWGDAIEAMLPQSHLQVELSIDPADDIRRLVLVGQGPGWAGRWDRLTELTKPWTEEGA